MPHAKIENPYLRKWKVITKNGKYNLINDKKQLISENWFNYCTNFDKYGVASAFVLNDKNELEPYLLNPMGELSRFGI